MKSLSALRRESHSLKLDQDSRLDDILAMLTDLKEVSEMVRENLSLGGRIDPDRVGALSAGLSRLALTEYQLEGFAKEQRVLRSLSFASRAVRHKNIPIAHNETFKWIIDPPQNSESERDDRNRYVTWLENGGGIFWVSGKAGSGKSTLMKFIAGHETTREILETWACPMRLVVAAHYFWSAGTQIERSHEGLLRTLLHDIFRSCSEVIPLICPRRWARVSATGIEEDIPWTNSEMTETLKRLSRLPDPPIRCCLFIDGVDEFDGDHLKLCEALDEISQSPNIKICLASRPWNVFSDSFGNDPARNICIEELTYNDILCFTESQLRGHPRWGLGDFEKRDQQAIIDEITNIAHGVFLWVFLVTKSLRDGLTNGDTLSDLRNRLYSFPTELEPFFRHMLEAVDPIYHEKMAGFLRIASNARQPLPFLIYSMHEYEYEDENYAANVSLTPLSEDEIELLRDQCQRRVNARCGGLLNAKNGVVEFLHRTVRDFLLTREMSEFLNRKTKAAFSVNLSTLRAYVAMVKHSPRTTAAFSEGHQIAGLLEEALQYAGEALEDSEDSANELLDDLENACFLPSEVGDSIFGWTLDMESIANDFSSNTNMRDVSLDSHFRRATLQAGVHKYVLRKLQENKYYFDDLHEPPLNLVVMQQQWSQQHVQTMRHLLMHDHDPNAKEDTPASISPWSHFMQHICKGENSADFHESVDSGLFTLFLECKAKRDDKALSLLERCASTRQHNQKQPIETPCGLYIKALFSHSPKHVDKSLRVLDDFVNFPPDTAPPVEIFEILNVELQNTDYRTTRMEKLKFIAKIVEKVIDIGISRRRDIVFLSSTIKKALPAALASPILVRMGQGRGALESEAGSRKRKAEAETEERNSKWRIQRSSQRHVSRLLGAIENAWTDEKDIL